MPTTFSIKNRHYFNELIKTCTVSTVQNRYKRLGYHEYKYTTIRSMHTRSVNSAACAIPSASTTFLHNTNSGTRTTIRDTVPWDHHDYSTFSFAKSNWVTSDLSAGSCHKVLVQLFAMTPHCLISQWPRGDHNYAEIWNQISSQY